MTLNTYNKKLPTPRVCKIQIIYFKKIHEINNADAKDGLKLQSSTKLHSIQI